MNTKDITLICVDCLNYDAALRAIAKSTQNTEFHKTLFITDKHTLKAPDNVEIKIIDKIQSREAYSNFMLDNIGDYFTSEFALIVQWDGYIINKDAWNPDFLNYDYIGAKWWHKDGLNVGNGGFSLRSRKLIQAIKKLNIKNRNDTEDNIICRTYRRELENKYGIKYADEKIADQFAYERGFTPTASSTPWGFHGFYNIHRHVNKNELEEILATLPSKTVLSSEFKELTFNLHTASRHEECIICCIKYLSHNPKEYNTLKMLYLSSYKIGQHWISAMAILQLSHKEPNNEVFKKELNKFNNYF
jgi:hypothetical protein